MEDTPKPRIQKPKTLEEACASYLADCRQRNLAKESLKKYNCDLNELHATQKHYNSWVKSRQEKLEELVRATWVPEQANEQPSRVV
jgi:hypothetical protein